MCCECVCLVYVVVDIGGLFGVCFIVVGWWLWFCCFVLG